ncbi:MAG: hypothetical protein LBS76_01435 [Mycoplasmataceae bacterium]|nr:hypothetical protein [Mycoplasmataceae bacterium]
MVFPTSPTNDFIRNINNKKNQLKYKLVINDVIKSKYSDEEFREILNKILTEKILSKLFSKTNVEKFNKWKKRVMNFIEWYPSFDTKELREQIDRYETDKGLAQHQNDIETTSTTNVVEVLGKTS